MKTYLVGGAVRDELLGRPVAERDWVVVGATAEDMRARGFSQVGRDFPVFLHPRTREEYALARTERKTGAGHGDFVCHADPHVTLEQDLKRRDLTINAMARDGGTLIDPYGGRRDLAEKVLRHVSPAFAEDPLRVFRVARFAAQLPEFRVADETLALLTAMTPALSALSGERVWKEADKAVAAPAPARFFEIVHAIGGTCWFDRLDLPATVNLFRSRTFDSSKAALAALGWANLPATVDQTYKRLRAPRLVQRGATALARHGRTLVAMAATDSAALLNALTAIEAFRTGDLAALVLEAAASSSGTSTAPLRRLIDELRRLRVDAEPGPGYGRALRQKRIAHIESRFFSLPSPRPPTLHRASDAIPGNASV